MNHILEAAAEVVPSPEGLAAKMLLLCVRAVGAPGAALGAKTGTVTAVPVTEGPIVGDGVCMVSCLQTGMMPWVVDAAASAAVPIRIFASRVNAYVLGLQPTSSLFSLIVLGMISVNAAASSTIPIRIFASGVKAYVQRLGLALTLPAWKWSWIAKPRAKCSEGSWIS